MNLPLKLVAGGLLGFTVGWNLSKPRAVEQGRAGAVDDLARQLADEPAETPSSSAVTAPFPAISLGNVVASALDDAARREAAGTMSTTTETTTVPHDGAVNDMGPLAHLYPLFNRDPKVGDRALCGSRKAGPGSTDHEPGDECRLCAACERIAERFPNR